MYLRVALSSWSSCVCANRRWLTLRWSMPVFLYSASRLSPFSCGFQSSWSIRLALQSHLHVSTRLFYTWLPIWGNQDVTATHSFRSLSCHFPVTQGLPETQQREHSSSPHIKLYNLRLIKSSISAEWCKLKILATQEAEAGGFQPSRPAVVTEGFGPV